MPFRGSQRGMGTDREIDQSMGNGQDTEMVTVRDSQQFVEGVGLATLA